MEQINQAIEALRDPELRSKYEQELEQFKREQKLDRFQELLTKRQRDQRPKTAPYPIRHRTSAKLRHAVHIACRGR